MEMESVLLYREPYISCLFACVVGIGTFTIDIYKYICICN